MLSKNLKLHIIKDVGELYLAGPDLVVLVPNFEQQISNLKMKIEVKEIDADSHPHIFLGCVKYDFELISLFFNFLINLFFKFYLVFPEWELRGSEMLMEICLPN